MRSELNSNFLKRRIISKKLPSSYQAQTLHQEIRECIDMDCLRMAYNKNCELLRSKKEKFLMATDGILKQVDHCFKALFICFVSQKWTKELHKIKNMHIQKFHKIETEETMKSIRQLYSGNEGTSNLKRTANCYLNKG